MYDRSNYYSMDSNDICHKYYEWYFKIAKVVSRAVRGEKFETILKLHEWYAKYLIQIMLLFVYTTIRKRFLIAQSFGYFKSSWNTTALSQRKWRKFSCSSIKGCFQPRKMSLLMAVLITVRVPHNSHWLQPTLLKNFKTALWWFSSTEADYLLLVHHLWITELFKNTRTLKFKSQLTFGFFLPPSIILTNLLGNRT